MQAADVKASPYEPGVYFVKDQSWQVSMDAPSNYASIAQCISGWTSLDSCRLGRDISSSGSLARDPSPLCAWQRTLRHARRSVRPPSPMICVTAHLIGVLNILEKVLGNACGYVPLQPHLGLLHQVVRDACSRWMVRCSTIGVSTSRVLEGALASRLRCTFP